MQMGESTWLDSLQGGGAGEFASWLSAELIVHISYNALLSAGIILYSLRVSPHHSAISCYFLLMVLIYMSFSQDKPWSLCRTIFRKHSLEICGVESCAVACRQNQVESEVIYLEQCERCTHHQLNSYHFEIIRSLFMHTGHLCYF